MCSSLTGPVITKLNFVGALAALVFFFVPWVGIEWKEEIHATQTGLQMICGEASAINRGGEAGGGTLGYSYLAGLAFVAVLAAVLFSFADLVTGKDEHSTGAGLLCVVAFVLLLAQGIAGFPAKTKILENQTKAARSMASMGKDNSLAEMLGSLRQQAADGLQVRALPWLALELAALGLMAPLFAIRATRGSASASLSSPRKWPKLQPDEQQ